MIENILFYIVFLSQIVLISYYYPRHIKSRLRRILASYPPADYPKLYPKPEEYYIKWKARYKIINMLILILGFSILVIMGINRYSVHGDIPNTLPVIYFIIQVFPLILMELAGFAYFKLMRKADLRTTRKAELYPRKLSNFISPAIIGLAILTNVFCIIFFYAHYDFEFTLRNDTFVIVLTLTLSNIIYAGIIYWNLYGKKLDPNQDIKDRLRQIDATVKSLVFISITASLFLVVIKVIDIRDLDYLEPILMSLYLQLIMVIGLGTMLKKIRLEDINFDVYKVNK